MTAHPTESAALKPHAMSPDLPVGATLVVALPLHRPERVNHRHNRRPPNPHPQRGALQPRRTARRPRANNRALAQNLPVGATLVVALPVHRPERVNHRHNRRPPNPHPRRTAFRPRAINRALAPTLPVGATLVVALPLHHPKRVNRTAAGPPRAASPQCAPTKAEGLSS